MSRIPEKSTKATEIEQPVFETYSSYDVEKVRYCNCWGGKIILTSLQLANLKSYDGFQVAA